MASLMVVMIFKAYSTYLWSNIRAGSTSINTIQANAGDKLVIYIGSTLSLVKYPRWFDVN